MEYCSSVDCLCHALTHEQPTWFDKCVERYTRLPFMVLGHHEVCIFFVYHEHKVYGKLPIIVKNNVNTFAW